MTDLFANVLLVAVIGLIAWDIVAGFLFGIFDAFGELFE